MCRVPAMQGEGEGESGMPSAVKDRIRLCSCNLHLYFFRNKVGKAE